MKVDLLKREIVIWLIVFFISLITLNTLFSTLLWDEAVYLSNAKSIFFGSKYKEDYRSPLLSFTISILWLLTGEYVIVAKMLVILLTLGCVYLTYIIGKSYFGRKSIFFSVLFSVSPLVLYWGTKIYTDVPSLFFILLSFYLLKTKKVLFSGVSSGLSFLTRFSASLFIFSTFIFLILKKRYKEMIIFALGLFICLVPWMIRNQVEHNNPFYDILTQMKFMNRWTEEYKDPVYQQTLNLIGTLGPLLLFLPLGVMGFMKRDERILIFTYILAFFIYFSFFMNMKLSRYLVMILPFIYLLVYEGFLDIEKRIKLKIFLYFFIIISCVILAFPVLSEYETDNLRWEVIEESVLYVKTNAYPSNLIMSNFWPYFCYFVDARCLSTWSDVDYLVKSYYPRYVVHHDSFGLETKINETWIPKRIFSNRLGTISIYEIS